MKVMNRLNSQNCGIWQVANKRTVLPFIHRIFDVGFEKAGTPAPVHLQRIVIFLNLLWMFLTCCPQCQALHLIGPHGHLH